MFSPLSPIVELCSPLGTMKRLEKPWLEELSYMKRGIRIFRGRGGGRNGAAPKINLVHPKRTSPSFCEGAITNIRVQQFNYTNSHLMMCSSLMWYEVESESIRKGCEVWLAAWRPIGQIGLSAEVFGINVHLFRQFSWTVFSFTNSPTKCETDPVKGKQTIHT